MRLRIKVTKNDIMRGTREDALSCPIARACKRLGYAPDVTEEEIEITCKETGRKYLAETPDVASDFINNFDDSNNLKRVFKPFEFTINAKLKTAEPWEDV